MMSEYRQRRQDAAHVYRVRVMVHTVRANRASSNTGQPDGTGRGEGEKRDMKSDTQRRSADMVIRGIIGREGTHAESAGVSV